MKLPHFGKLRCMIMTLMPYADQQARALQQSAQACLQYCVEVLATHPVLLAKYVLLPPECSTLFSDDEYLMRKINLAARL